MYHPFRYRRIKAIPHCWAVYLGGQFIGEVRLFRGGWHFDTFDEPRFHSEVPAPYRALAVAQWPGLRQFDEFGRRT